ncbi:MAG: phage portal protein [Clostridia bacterium]|nr:phage portal protein [Clostridia bacterium]MBQ8130790.1 phage portal protein [Clostridia bacterium]
MGFLEAFLHPIAVEETKKVEISKRFVGEDGKPVPFEIKTIPQGDNSQLIKKYTRRKLVNGTTTEIFDTTAYTNALIVECTVQPDFQDSRMCEAYGVLDPMLVPGKMLLSGEYSALVGEIMKLNGFDADSLLKDEEEAKN